MRAEAPSGTRTIVLAWLGVLATALVVWLGLVTPFDHPTRTRVDNALLLLGLSGLAIPLLLVRARMVPPGAGARVALAGYALLSALAVAVADFGASRATGWAIKAVGFVVLLFTLRDLAVTHDP
jgi:hypothetical protein